MQSNLTPYILASYGALLAALFGVVIAGGKWVISQLISHGKDLVRIQAALDFYLDRKGKGAAVVLEAATNPTPEQVKTLLRKYREQRLAEDERDELVQWLRAVSKANMEKYWAAQEMLSVLGAQERLKKAVNH